MINDGRYIQYYRFDVLIKALNLGARSQHIVRLKRAFIIILIISAPIFIIVMTLKSLQIQATLMNYTIQGFQFLFTLLGFFSSIVLLIVVVPRMRKINSNQSNVRLKRTAQRKNLWIGMNLVLLVLLVIPYICLRFFVVTSLPYNYTGMRSILEQSLYRWMNITHNCYVSIYVCTTHCNMASFLHSPHAGEEAHIMESSTQCNQQR